jgi:hypothetical protein
VLADALTSIAAIIAQFREGVDWFSKEYTIRVIFSHG